MGAYALQNPDTSYCQGMNYVMGFLYIHILDEPNTHKCFENLMRNYFHNMFTKDLYTLKLLFYQFERCLTLFLPELAGYFKVKINIKIMYVTK